MSDRTKSNRRVTLEVPPELSPPPREPDTDLPALREIYVCQLRQEERDKLEGLCESLFAYSGRRRPPIPTQGGH